MKDLEDFVKLHPEGSVNLLTKKIWSDVLGTESSWGLYIPNDLILDYMRGLLAFNSKGFNTCIIHFEILKNRLTFRNENNEEVKELVGEVFASLSVSYLALQKKDELKNLAQEAMLRFPEDLNLNKQLQQLVN